MLKESLELHRQGRFDEAEQGYRAVLDANPDDAEALHLLGMLRHQRGDSAEGAALLARARVLAPDDANIELSLASMQFRAGDHAAAQQGFERALALDPNLGGAYTGMGQIVLMQGDLDGAERHFRIALRAGEDPHALAGLGALRMARGDAGGALRHLCRAAELAPHDAMIQLQLGEMFARHGTLDFAEQAFNNALRLQPNLHKARYLLGAALYRMRRFREAEAQFGHLLGEPALEASARTAIADVARSEGRHEDAIAGYQAAAAIEPPGAGATGAIAQSLAALGRNGDALAACDAYLARDPGNRSVRLERLDHLVELGRLAEAGDECSALFESGPADVELEKRVAAILERLGRFEEARAHADHVLQVQPDAIETKLLRVRSQLFRGETEGARAALAELAAATTLTERQARQCWHYQGLLQDRNGAWAEAARCFREALRGFSGPLQAPAEPHRDLHDALAEPAGQPSPQAPVLLLGLPGSGVERVAALLADQPRLALLGGHGHAVFDAPQFARYLGPLDEAEREALRERYLAPLRGAGLADRQVVDWLPQWDAHLLAVARRAMPGTRLVVVGCDARDALLNWLAFGGGTGFPGEDPVLAAYWLGQVRRHLAWGADLDDPRRIEVGADALFEDERQRLALARFLDLDDLRPGATSAAASRGLGGLPTRFAPGHWRHYADVLAEPFRLLA